MRGLVDDDGGFGTYSSEDRIHDRVPSMVTVCSLFIAIIPIDCRSEGGRGGSVAVDRVR